MKIVLKVLKYIADWTIASSLRATYGAQLQQVKPTHDVLNITTSVLISTGEKQTRSSLC